MYKNKRILLIAGGGTLGTYTAKELLRLGASVEVVCPEEKISDHENLSFHRTMATDEFLTALFENNHYDAIVNYIHYIDPEEYRRVYPLLISHTDQLVFLSSYRVYADEMHPITEEAPRLYDVIDDADFLAHDNYAVPKSKCEDFLRNECAGDPFTIVRPVISFSHRRMDIVLNSGREVLKCAEAGREMVLPESVRHLHAGIDWAGNSGKLIANLLLKPAAYGETYNIYSGHGMTWDDIANAYADVLGLKVYWGTDEEYIISKPTIREPNLHGWMWKYDRKFDRMIDASKVLAATGLTGKDFASVREGIAAELAILRPDKK